MATRRVEINNETIFPFQVHTWDVSLEKSNIIVRSYSKAEGKDIYTFPFKEGTINFYNGFERKYCYFRSKRFQKFLMKHGLTTVKNEDPNRNYYVKSHNSGYGSYRYGIKTDGEVQKTRLGGDFDEITNIPNACYSNEYELSVKGATWVILARKIDYLDNHSSATILYTKKKIESLKLPSGQALQLK